MTNSIPGRPPVDTTTIEPPPVKRPWHAPKLALHGDVATLTEGGKLDATLDGASGLS